MILYFSGTGNTKFIANRLAAKLADDISDLGSIINNQDKWHFYSEKPFVIVCPIYAWRIPFKIENMLAKASFTGSKDIYFIFSMGGQFGAADKYVARLMQGNNLNIKGYTGILMPDNFTIVFNAPTAEESDHIISLALDKIDLIANKINDNLALSATKHHYIDNFLSTMVNHGFAKFMMSAKRFGCNDDCIHCNLCVNNCPTNNIRFNGDQLAFGNDCMFCLKCIQSCPTHAITYKGKKLAKGYYTCPKK
ncbi:MAG: EFR1 family ferrodoxin [Erysipelotrichaceae bacterium]|nr:EFR1 family ferrodoxin [Erysipelotrichaceae bacterium]MDY5251858.1 EFR1 family ferrodoxin [Erysipelotrichaceae bacterium]